MSQLENKAKKIEQLNLEKEITNNHERFLQKDKRPYVIVVRSEEVLDVHYIESNF